MLFLHSFIHLLFLNKIHDFNSYFLLPFHSICKHCNECIVFILSHFCQILLSLGNSGYC